MLLGRSGGSPFIKSSRHGALRRIVAAVELRVLGLVDHAHATTAKLFDDAVMAAIMELLGRATLKMVVRIQITTSSAHARAATSTPRDRKPLGAQLGVV